MLNTEKPPLCKGRWHGEAVTEGLLRQFIITYVVEDCSCLKQSPSQKSKIFASPLYTRGPLQVWQ